MEKTKKSFIGKIAALLLMLTVVSCCFLGSTFAKYTSSKTGTAEVGVAEWKVIGVSANATTADQTFGLTVSKMSPNHESDPNTLSSAEYTITNESEVDALITLTLGNLQINHVENATYNGVTVSYDAANGIFTYTEDGSQKTILSIIDIQKAITFTVSAKKDDNDVSGDLQDNGVKLAAKTDDGTTESIVITVTATWRTQSDEADTMIGMYVESVTQSLTVVATQASTVAQK